MCYTLAMDLWSDDGFADVWECPCSSETHSGSGVFDEKLSVSVTYNQMIQNTQTHTQMW